MFSVGLKYIEGITRRREYMKFIFQWLKRHFEILLLPRKHKIRIPELTCNVLFMIWTIKICMEIQFCKNWVSTSCG